MHNGKTKNYGLTSGADGADGSGFAAAGGGGGGGAGLAASSAFFFLASAKDFKL